MVVGQSGNSNVGIGTTSPGAKLDVYTSAGIGAIDLGGVNGISYPACNNHPIVGTATMWFNPNCFSPEAFGTLGNFAREGLIGPGLEDVDMALLKTTRIRENMTLQFRAEVFNIFNHTNLSLPIASVFTGAATAASAANPVISATAGNILTAAVPSREIQLGLKLIF